MGKSKGKASRRRESLYSERKVETKHPKERFLIVCEGEKTEPNYFRSFRVPKDVQTIIGLGDNTIGLVETAIELANKDEYDQVWCVFDRDSFPAANFNGAFQLAKNNEIKIAYSNEAFEIWYLLHFDYLDSAQSRADYGRALSKRLGRKYEKNSPTIYAELEALQGQAIKNAAKLLHKCNPLNPERNNPSTTVHLLVLQLNRFISV